MRTLKVKDVSGGPNIFWPLLIDNKLNKLYLSLKTSFLHDIFLSMLTFGP